MPQSVTVIFLTGVRVTYYYLHWRIIVALFQFFFQQIYGFCGESCMMLQWQVIVYTYLFLSLFGNTVLILIIFCVNRTANTSVDVSGGILTYLLSRTSEKCVASVFVAAECTESALTSCEVDPPYIITDDSDSSSVCKLVQHLLVAPRERIC